jgi:hypothetical protein
LIRYFNRHLGSSAGIAGLLWSLVVIAPASGQVFNTLDVEDPWLEPEAEPLVGEQTWNAPSLAVYFENDGSFLRPNGNTDRHYSSGQGLGLTWHEDAGDGIADTLGLPYDGTALGLTLVQQMFTPDEIDEPRGPNDRFYAGYLYLGGFWQREYRNTLDHVQLDLGVVGPSSGAEFNQEWVHDLFKQPDPDWSGQLRDEFAYNLSWRRKWRLGPSAGLAPLDEEKIWSWQLIPEVGVDLGNVYRRAHAGGIARFGFNLPDDFGPGRMTDPRSATAAVPPRGFSTYAFAGVTGRYVEWNTFIEGSNTRNPSPSLSLEPWQGEVTAGFAVDWRTDNWVCNVAYSQTYFTHAYEEQETEDGVGRISLRVRYDF